METINYLWSLPYFKYEIFFIFLPFVLLLATHWRLLLKYKKIYFYITILSVIWGYMFDIAAINHNVWFFTQRSLGYVFGLPLEEFYFLFFVPYILITLLLIIRKSIYHLPEY